MKTNHCIIYKITNNVNTKVYVGQTWYSLQDRFISHKKPSSNGCVKLYRAFNKHGRNNFKIEFITLCHTQEIANYYEQEFIKYYNSIKNGYNAREGGLNGQPSEETKQKMRKPRSELAKQNMRKPKSATHRKNLSIAKLGKALSDECKRKMSLARLGNKNCVGRIPWNKGLRKEI